MEELEDEDVLEEEGRRGGFAFEELAHSTSRMSSHKKHEPFLIFNAQIRTKFAKSSLRIWFLLS